MKKFFKEFQEFILRGSVIDMAIGVIIGAAFNSIITSLVKDILTPLIAVFTKETDFSALVFQVQNLFGTGPVDIRYGVFIQAVISFLIMAFCLFLVVKGVNRLTRLRKKNAEDETDETEKDLSAEELLTEIRDLLKAENEDDHENENDDKSDEKNND